MCKDAAHTARAMDSRWLGASASAGFKVVYAGLGFMGLSNPERHINSV